MLNPMEALVKDLMTTQVAYDKACQEANAVRWQLDELSKKQELALEELRMAKRALAEALNEDIQSEVALNGR